MIIHQNTLISDDILKEHFACDVRMCKGACCVEGESGAPLQPSEIQQIEDNLSSIVEELDEEHRGLIENHGFYETDHDGELVTKCLDNGQCCFVTVTSNGTMGCGIESAYYQRHTDFIKPISCHLYPIRVKTFETYTVLNYHQWHLCKDACAKGNKLSIKVYDFAEAALRRRFGDIWFDELKKVLEADPPI